MFAASTCSSAACQAVLRENFVNRGRTAVIVPGRAGVGPGGDDDPVADDGQVGVRRRLVDEAAWYLAAQLAELGEHVVGAAMLDRDPAGDDVVAGEGLVQAAQPVVPAERFEFGQAKTPLCPRVHESGARDCAPVGEVRSGGRSEFRLADGPRERGVEEAMTVISSRPPRVGAAEDSAPEKRIAESGRSRKPSDRSSASTRFAPRGGPRRGRRSARGARGGRRRRRGPRRGARAARRSRRPGRRAAPAGSGRSADAATRPRPSRTSRAAGARPLEVGLAGAEDRGRDERAAGGGVARRRLARHAEVVDRAAFAVDDEPRPRNRASPVRRSRRT